MAATRLVDSEKQELVRRFRQGESTQALADHFGCSTTTITRMVRAEMGPEAYAAVKDQRQRGGRDRQISLAIDSDSARDIEESADHQPPAASTEQEMGGGSAVAKTPSAPEAGWPPPSPEPAPLPPVPPAAAPAAAEPGSGGRATAASLPSPSAEEEPLASDDEGATVLAIDDADDFSADEEAEDDLLPTDDDGEDDVASDMEDFHPVAVLPIAVDDQRETLPAPWSPEALPACAYLLVDKTVELQAQPLGEIPELGRLPSDEQERQALVLFTNPRQAKRHCGRTQRVIKLPDPAIVGRTAPYLLAQGISRVVIEGTLYALPDPQ